MIKDDSQPAKLKLRRSPRQKPQEGMDFTLDMKRLGMMADIQGVNETKKKLILKCRHISPPPPVLTGGIEDAETTKQSDPTRDEDIPSTHSKINRKQNTTKCLFKFPF